MGDPDGKIKLPAGSNCLKGPNTFAALAGVARICTAAIMRFRVTKAATVGIARCPMPAFLKIIKE